MFRARRLAVAVAVAAVAATGSGAATASAGQPSSPLRFPAGSVPTISIVRPATGFAMAQSNNWSGYNQGALEKTKTFQSVSGEWAVPTATARVRGQDEYSSSWVGIGGGCVDSGCAVTDETLIQAGTEQDVAKNGRAAYYTWYEVIPAPMVQAPLAVRPGNLVWVSIRQSEPEVWTIQIVNRSTRRSWSTTVPYSSDFATAEWIEETPLVFGTNGAQTGPLPRLTTLHFDLARVNGAGAGLVAAEAIQLVSASGRPLATPSVPDSDRDGFADCAYASRCARPGT
jgi:hypothetical protein